MRRAHRTLTLTLTPAPYPRCAALTAGVLTEIAECHLGAYTCYHAQLSDALAHANAEGAGRQARERERLFGAAAADAADATGAVSCL